MSVRIYIYTEKQRVESLRNSVVGFVFSKTENLGGESYVVDEARSFVKRCRIQSKCVFLGSDRAFQILT